MSEPTALDLVRGLYDYHWWANRRLFDVAAGLGEELAGREVGRQFSAPSVTRMLAHVYGADAIWLARWNGQSPTAIPGADLRTLAALRKAWDRLEAEQRAFIGRLTAGDLGREIAYRNTEGKPLRAGLWRLLQHVANHATHHRSEIATMITMISASPPDTGINTYLLLKTGQT